MSSISPPLSYLLASKIPPNRMATMPRPGAMTVARCMPKSGKAHACSLSSRLGVRATSSIRMPRRPEQNGQVVRKGSLVLNYGALTPQRDYDTGYAGTTTRVVRATGGRAAPRRDRIEQGRSRRHVRLTGRRPRRRSRPRAGSRPTRAA